MAPLLVLCAVGCATLGGGPSARVLREQADAALAHQDFEGAYRLLAEIRIRHPESAESAAAFPLAARLFKREYNRNRFANPTSPWVTQEPAFLYAWLADFFGDTFPADAVHALCAGLPRSFALAFLDFGRSRPAVAAWRMEVHEDDGIVESITAERVANARR